MELLGAGRDSDVFAHGPGTVLRRYRDGRSAAAEAAVARRLHDLGYPVPAVWAVEGPGLVMERVGGVTMARALLAGELSPEVGGELLAGLHDRLHALPWPGGQFQDHRGDGAPSTALTILCPSDRSRR